MFDGHEFVSVVHAIDDRNIRFYRVVTFSAGVPAVERFSSNSADATLEFLDAVLEAGLEQVHQARVREVSGG